MPYANPEAKRQQNQRYWLKNKERLRLENSEYRKKNRKAIQATQAKWKELNPEKVKEATRRKYIKHKAAIDARNKKWAQAHKELLAARMVNWRKTSPSYKENVERTREEQNRKRNERRRKHKEFYREYNYLAGCRSPRRAAIYIKWELCNNLCYLCGLDLPKDDIHVDHVMPIYHGGTNHIDNLMPAHSNCNKKKSNRLDYFIVRPDLLKTAQQVKAFPRSKKEAQIHANS